ncbi:conjugal transfer protein TraF [Vibrio coralliilyticus]|uniref:conjugal transfer protein TraF n=2 Tax=Vibrio coralliilyticus TaxID=190893 RepID=UPI00035E8576|nr:conjugal transfer protein TraF [Vibrio coralliilyticus]
MMARTLALAALIWVPWSTAAPLGWRWYNVPTSVSAPVASPLTPQAQLRWFHQHYQASLAQATLAPNNPEYALKLMRLHRFILRKTEQTASTFQRVLLMHPELSTLVDHPAGQTARAIYYRQQDQTQSRTLDALSEKGWGLFWLYRGADPYSQALAPSLQAFADAHHLALLGISDDGVQASGLKHHRHHRGQLAITTTPALLLVQPSTRRVRPVAYGFLSTSELARRLYHVVTEFRHVAR